jgi:hypothetical protein
MRFHAALAASKYRPAGSADVAPKQFLERVSICQTCPQRRANRCHLAGQLVSVQARRKSSSCPKRLWPGDPVPVIASQPSPLPIELKRLPPRPIETVEVITTYFNPCGYARLRDNHQRFRECLAAPVTTAELAFDDDPFDLPDSRRYRGTRARHWLWQKERLLNLLILGSTADAVAWIDADLIFLNKNVLEEARQKLETSAVVQLFEGVADTNAEGRVIRQMRGHVHARRLGQSWGRPGGAWMARREDLISWGGLYDRNIIGGGDSAARCAWEGASELPPSMQYGSECERHWRVWAAGQRVDGAMDYCQGEAVHLYHGSRENRRYNERYSILADDHFDPGRDVEVDPQTGLLQWSAQAMEQKPNMVARVRDYFADRKEDE